MPEPKSFVATLVKNIDWQGYRIATWVGLLLLAGIIALTLVRGNWGNVLIFILFFAGTALIVTIHHKMPSFFSLVVVIAATTSAAGWAWNWYEQYWAYDEIAHALSTLALTLVAAFYMYRSLAGFFCEHLFLLSATLICIGLAIGAIWEVVEFYFIVPRYKMALPDTISDLIVDGVGALLAVPISIWAVRQAPDST